MAKGFAALLVVLALLVLTVGDLSPAASAAAPAPAHLVAGLARAQDAAATEAYIKANYALAHTAVAGLPSLRASLVSLVHQVRSECPGIAVGSPQNGDAEQLSDEVIGALSVVAFRIEAPAILRFTRAVASLRWSDPRLTRMVRTYAAKLKGMADLAMPDLCADVGMWARSGFQTLSPSTAVFDRRFVAVKIETEEVPPDLLARYEHRGEAAIVHRTGRLEGQLVDAEAQAVYDWSRILDALGLNP